MQLKGRNSARLGGGEDNTAQIFGFLVAHLNARTEPRVSFLSTNVTSSSGGLGWSRSGSRSVRAGVHLRVGLVGADSCTWEVKQRAIFLRKWRVQGCPDLGGEPSHGCQEGGTEGKATFVKLGSKPAQQKYQEVCFSSCSHDSVSLMWAARWKISPRMTLIGFQAVGFSHAFKISVNAFPQPGCVCFLGNYPLARAMSPRTRLLSFEPWLYNILWDLGSCIALLCASVFSFKNKGWEYHLITT